MEFQTEMNLPLHRAFSSCLVPRWGTRRKNKRCDSSPEIRLLLDRLHLDFFLFQMGESNDDIDQMFSNLLGEMDLLTQVNPPF